MKKVEVNQVSQSNLKIEEKSTQKAQEGWLSYFQTLEDPWMSAKYLNLYTPEGCSM